MARAKLTPDKMLSYCGSWCVARPIAAPVLSLLLLAAAPHPEVAQIHPTIVEPLTVAQRVLEMERLDRTNVDYDISTNGRLLIYAAFDRSVADNNIVTGLWLQNLATKAPPIRLASEKPTSAPRAIVPRLSPDGRTVAYISGEETGAVTLINLKTRRKTLIKPQFATAPGDKDVPSLTDVKWAPDGLRLAVRFIEKTDTPPLKRGVSVSAEWFPWLGLDPVPRQRLAVIDRRDGRVLAMTGENRNITEAEWSPNGRLIAITAGRVVQAPGENRLDDRFETDIYLFDSVLGSESVISDAPGADREPRWSPDGYKIAFSSSRSFGERGRIGIFNVASQTKRYIGHDWQFTPRMYLWIDNKRLAAITYEKMGCPIRTIETETEITRRLSPDDLSCNQALLWASNARKLLFKRQSFMAPVEIAASSIDRWSPQALTQFGAGLDLPPAELRSLSWPSKDGRFTIHGLLITPKDGHQGRRPLVVSINGGPNPVTALELGGGDAAHLLHPMLARGYAVLMPNTRGRAGYSQAFKAAMPDYQDYLEGPFNDVIGGVELLDRMKIADTSRMAVIGFSYGGALSAYTVARSDRFRAAMLGDSTVLDFLESGYVIASNKYGSLIERRIMGLGPIYEPAEKEARARNSVLSHVQKIKTPMLLECGMFSGATILNSCPKIFQGLQYFKVPSEFVVYPRTDHGIVEPALRYDSERRRLEWLDYWVLGTPISSMVERFGPPKLAAWQRRGVTKFAADQAQGGR